jgi:hypothetical protein
VRWENVNLEGSLSRQTEASSQGRCQEGNLRPPVEDVEEPTMGLSRQTWLTLQASSVIPPTRSCPSRLGSKPGVDASRPSKTTRRLILEIQQTPYGPPVSKAQ